MMKQTTLYKGHLQNERTKTRQGWVGKPRREGKYKYVFLFILNYRTMGTIYSQIICHTIECLRCYFFHNILLFVHLVYFLFAENNHLSVLFTYLFAIIKIVCSILKGNFLTMLSKHRQVQFFFKKNHVKEILQCNQNLIQIFGLRYITFFQF